MTTQTAPNPPANPPVTVSPDAVRALADNIRKWSGWNNATLLLGTEVNIAQCDHETRTFRANPDALVLNPHRVLRTVTPFRLRQEAVLTGALLHEAGHARHSLWKPCNDAELAEYKAGTRFRHSDGSEVTKQTMALARLLEEPRVEGLMARDEKKVGALGLGWTMRASAAHVVPMTALAADPNQKIMDLITSWVLRAGRQVAIQHWTGHPLPKWARDFDALLHTMLVVHLSDPDADPFDPDYEDPSVKARKVTALLREMIGCEDDRGPTMIDTAREVLSILFPETTGDEDDAPMPTLGCDQREDAQPDEQDSDDEQEPEPGEGEGDEQEPEQEPEQGDDEGEGQPEDGEPGDGDEDGEGDESEDESEGDAGGGEDGEGESSGDPDSDSEGEGGATGSTDSDEDSDDDSELAEALKQLEAQAADETKEEAEVEADEPPPANDEDVQRPGSGLGGGSEGGGWRHPDKPEREVAKNAERFLRNLIAPSESSTVSLTESPGSTVDGAALAAWKAGGQVRDPKFFKRTHREVQPSPPVRIGILVDVSQSMEALQKPSALLSWALASAALDLRNFAGRGQQVESTLIHWGRNARVIQPNGAPLPGIREFPCNEGTAAMHSALDLLEEQMPGFFDLTDKPANRLIVQFTDWQLNYGESKTAERVSKALAAGVNMLSVVPQTFGTGRYARYESLDNVMKRCPVQRGVASVMKYDKAHPERVWDVAAQTLGK